MTTTGATLPVRPELVGEVPYGAPQLDVPVQLNVNENPYPPSDRVVAEIAAAVATAAKSMNRYPERDAIELRGDLARYLGHDLTADEVWAANGSNEVMLHVLMAFGGPGRSALSFAPTYSMYPEYARDTHTAWTTFPRADDFTIDADVAVAAVGEQRPDVVLIASPNNPTGTAVPLATVAAIADAAPGVVVVDEAYFEFARAGTPSALELLPDHPRLAVTRTMSKAFAFAGGRLGYLAASAAFVDALRVVRLPYHLSAVTQAVARVALANADELLGTVAALRAARDDLASWLAGQGLQVADSDANFVLFGRFSDRTPGVAGSAGPRGVDPAGRPGRLAAGVRRHPGRDGGVQGRPDRGPEGELMSRTAQLERVTSESKVGVRLDLDGSGRSVISTGVGFYDHMLTALAKHALFDLEVESVGDVHIDGHHVVEDTAIVLGQAIREALGDKSGIRRFGDALVPLDEALAQAVVDVSGRPYCVHSGEPAGQEHVLIGGGTADSVPYAGSLTRHVLETLAFHAHLCLHVRVLAGRDPHHVVEAQFKAVARALRDAVAFDPRVEGIPSTKGAL